LWPVALLGPSSSSQFLDKGRIQDLKIPSWLWWGLGLVLGFVLLVGILFPVFVSSSVIKDRIESEFAKNTTGELSLASAKISAWGGLKIKLTDIKVTDANKREALNAKKAAVSIPFLAIFGMGSKVKLGITEPKILVVQNAGETNWQKLMQRETSGPQGSESPPPAPAKDAAPMSAWIMQILSFCPAANRPISRD